jgi:hypothetical protein
VADSGGDDPPQNGGGVTAVRSGSLGDCSGKRKERVMKETCAALFLGTLTILAFGCSTSPEHLSAPDLDALNFGPAAVARAPVDGETVGNVLTPPAMQHGFAILDLRARRDEYDRVFVVGEVKNVGTVTKGVELQAALRDAGGRLVAVGHFYPAGDYSIGPNQTWPFAHSFGKQEDGVEAELRIVGAFRTIVNLGTVSLMR